MVKWDEFTQDFSFNLGCGLDLSSERNELMKPIVPHFYAVWMCGKRESPHRLGIELSFSGRLLNRQKLEDDFNANQYAPEELRRLTKGFNQLSTLAPGYSFIFEKERLVWESGLNIGVGTFSKAHHQMFGYSSADLASPDFFFQVNHGDRFIGPFGFYGGLHSKVFFKFRKGSNFGLSIGVNYRQCHARIDAKYTYGPTYKSGTPIYNEAYSVLYNEYDKLRFLSVTIGVGAWGYNIK
ncbi:MAG: hypothetical protein Crog3KO_26290 [Crocinitomicaceae bacterium]